MIAWQQDGALPRRHHPALAVKLVSGRHVGREVRVVRYVCDSVSGKDLNERTAAVSETGSGAGNLINAEATAEQQAGQAPQWCMLNRAPRRQLCPR